MPLHRSSVVALPLIAWLLAPDLAHAADATARPLHNPANDPTSDPASAPTRLTHGPEHAVAHDPGHGRPALLWSPAAEPAPAWLAPEAVARAQLDRQRLTHGVSRDVLNNARLRFVHDLGRGGRVVVLRPTVAGVEVFQGDIKVLIDRHNRPVATAGAPHPAAHPGSARPFVQGPAAAVHSALADLAGPTARAAALLPRTGPAGWSYFVLGADAPAAIPTLLQPARARPVYYPVGDALLPAHLVELQARMPDGLEVVQYVIAADDGALLHRRDATAHESYKYRVWADPDGDHRPADGPLEDFTPHPTGVPGPGPVGSIDPPLISIEGFNTNPEGGADPWLPPGATETRGNNVDAYVDHSAPEGLDPDDFRATVTAPGVFDRIYDLTLEPLASQFQSMAAITQLFYVNNWLHDDWYDSGFNEAAGNAQTDNFGRGGIEGDPLQAQAQDAALGGARNNANMSTPFDGASPTMQMYLWGGLTTTADLTVMPLGGDIAVGLAQFGPVNFDITGPLVLIEDSGGVSPSDGCEPPLGDLNGKIVLIDRGDCTFETKVTFAQEAGAIGVIIADNLPSNKPLSPGNDGGKVDPTIPTQGTNTENGDFIKAGLKKGPQTAHMVGVASVERDGTIDNMIVGHEWGHYLHHRLVECGNAACAAQSEGWGDFVALHMMLREGDPLSAVYSADSYASFDPSAYFGIRRVPYSVDFARNALTYRHISDGEPLPAGHPLQDNGIANSEVHNAGEVWATMMWEAYIAIQAAHGDQSFAANRRLFADHVVAGMMLAPVNPTFTEQRDAILMAAAATSKDDFNTIAEAFARRGAGSCAVSPPTNSINFKGVVEDFQLRANGVLLSAAIVEGDATCDHDGVIDLGEDGRIDLEFYNGGAAALAAGSTIEVLDPDPALVFPDGLVLTMPALAALEKTSASIPLTVKGLDDYHPLTLKLRVTTPDGCQQTHERQLATVLHADLQTNASATDDVEAEPSAWFLTGGADTVWRRQASEQSGFYWHADDVGRASDTRLESPPLTVAADKPLTIRFEHAYNFEFSDGTYWDGAIIELSRDAGITWEDLSVYAKPGYNGTIASAANPINGRPAFVGTSPGYPIRSPLLLDLGTQLAGETIKFRFRVGTDAAAGAPGWDIDNIAFDGVTNTPFPRWQVDQQVCSETSGPDDSSGPASDADTTPTEGGGEAATDPTDTASTDTAGATDDDGCNCAATPTRPRTTWLTLLLLLALPRRRRRTH